MSAMRAHFGRKGNVPMILEAVLVQLSDAYCSRPLGGGSKGS